MPSITKPAATHPSLERNSLGLTIHSVTAAIIRGVWELALSPHMIGKLSGIGCSSKTPTYFVSGAHGFNSAHGRMPAIATGANAANRELVLIGISGDGDSLSIGIGHMVHAVRRNVNILYVIENNGVYGLTKGQFSASADVGSKSKRGEPNRFSPIDPVTLGLSLGATFIARGFSGDKEQLIPILKAGIAHRGLALVDVISPCVTFNDHEGSTKSYLNTRKHMVKVTESDLVLPVESIHKPIARDGATAVTMHDGTVVNFTKVPDDYDPRDRTKVFAYLQEHVKTGCVPTGLLFIEENAGDVHDLNNTTEIPLSRVPFETLCPGSAELERLQEEFR